MRSFALLLAAIASVCAARDVKVLTPEALIEAPRPGAGVANPRGNLALVGTTSYSFSKDAKTSDLYLVTVPDIHTHGSDRAGATRHIPKPPVLVSNTSTGFWLSATEAAYVIDGALYGKNASLKPDARDPGFRIGALPAPIDNVKVVGATGDDPSGDDEITLVFSATVFEDGELEKVKEHEKSSAQEEWTRVKTYDTTMVRHWDEWINPSKFTQLFSVDLRRDVKGYSVSWSFSSGFRNLLQGTKLQSPVAPFGGPGDFAASKEHVAWTSKDPDLNPAWHTKQNIYLAPLKGGEAPRKVSSGDHGATSAPQFSPDGKNLVWLQMARDGFESDRNVIIAYNLATGKRHVLLGEWDSSPSSLVFSVDGKTLFITSEHLESDSVFSLPLKTVSDDEKDAGLYLADPTLEEPHALELPGSTTSVQPLWDGRVLLTASSIQSPANLFVKVPREKKLRIEQLTDFVAWSELAGTDFGPEPEKFTYPGAKGRDAYGWIIRPPSWDPKKKWPVAVLIHGGPEGSWTDSWSTRWNPAVFAAAGFLVVTFDPAGSKGFGQDYQEEILGNWGGAPYQDIKAGVHYILDTMPSVDAERVVAAGASYGGFMINWLQGHNEDDLFKGFVCHDGVFNTVSTFYSTDELYFAEFEFGGVPWSRKDDLSYTRWNPEAHTSNWNTPQLVIHGGRDYRLTEAEGLSAFNTLQRRGVPSRLVFFPDESHWVLGEKNSLRWHQEVIGWLQKWSAEKGEKVVGAETKVASAAQSGAGIVFQRQ